MDDTQLKIEQLEKRLESLKGFFDQKAEEDDVENFDILDEIDEVEKQIKRLKMEKQIRG